MRAHNHAASPSEGFGVKWSFKQVDILAAEQFLNLPGCETPGAVRRTIYNMQQPRLCGAKESHRVVAAAIGCSAFGW